MKNTSSKTGKNWMDQNSTIGGDLEDSISTSQNMRRKSAKIPASLLKQNKPIKIKGGLPKRRATVLHTGTSLGDD